MMQLVIVLGTMIAVGTILYGVKAMKSNKTGNLRTQLLTSIGLFSAMVVAFVVVGADQVVLAATAETANTAAATGLSLGDGFKYLAAALSTGLATIGTGVAVGSVGSSAIGAVSEDPTILGKTLIFVGMAEGIAIYGMIISILILFI
ncbi:MULTISPECIES: ATP synthase subunit C [Cellulosilyticum]|uniref:H+transporting two-sector ATPase C subunit n=1 Tax=Cellulosilyticum lentocellum (strain ATCC 49066 / DSM 5427 / NCIMB 11756 / RHM5) TaxID=642492 RepID=F2JI59_CELLD|nr:ATP synthase subunit C [Cellulosilyticum lentocellum]ADZ83087.1 H+transporting two-sector ATPase C subunit [Cellulosilyticum lentocellum DSM 5427]